MTTATNIPLERRPTVRLDTTAVRAYATAGEDLHKAEAYHVKVRSRLRALVEADATDADIAVCVAAASRASDALALARLKFESAREAVQGRAA